jgi:hypothetical protein
MIDADLIANWMRRVRRLISMDRSAWLVEPKFGGPHDRRPSRQFDGDTPAQVVWMSSKWHAADIADTPSYFRFSQSSVGALVDPIDEILGAAARREEGRPGRDRAVGIARLGDRGHVRDGRIPLRRRHGQRPDLTAANEGQCRGQRLETIVQPTGDDIEDGAAP